MSQILSQNEIDSLLKGINDGEISPEFDISDESDEIMDYDLSNKDRIVRGRMPTLDIIHDRFVRMFRLSVSSVLRKVVDINVRSTELIKFGEFLNTLPVPSSLNLFRMHPLRGNAIMIMETRLVFTLIDILFGGTGELEVKSDGKDFTAIEQKITKKLIISALEDLHTAWRPVFPVQITYTRTEINPQFVAIVPHNEVVIVVTFDLEISKAPMTMTLCMPYSMVEPIRSQLQAGFQSDVNEMDIVTVNRFKSNLMDSEVMLSVELGKTLISVRNFLEFKTGDVVTLDQESEEPLPVKVENAVKFLGVMGSHKGMQSIKIKDMVYNPIGLEDFG